MNLLDQIDKRTILNRKRLGDERDGLVFKKINPLNLDPNIRPNSYDWTAEEFNRKVVDRIVKEEESREKGIIINEFLDKTKNEEMMKKFEEECERLSKEKNQNI